MEYHTLGYWVSFLFIGAIIGWLAGILIRGRGFGIIGDIVIGVIGAILGGAIAGVLGIYTSSPIGSFLVSLAGAVILVGLTRFVTRLNV